MSSGRGLLAAGAAGALGGALAAAALLFVAGRTDIHTRLVRDALARQPEILIETADLLRDRQFAPAIAAQRSQLFAPFGSSWKGATQPDVVLVEFFDYACAYCRASLPHIERLLAEDKGLRVVFRELPILGPDSHAAARLSLTASKAGRFAAFHDALWSAGKPAAATIGTAARTAGIASEPPPDPALEAEIRRNFQLAESLGATGTPLFVIGDRVLNGAVGYEALKAAIAQARERG